MVSWIHWGIGGYDCVEGRSSEVCSLLDRSANIGPTRQPTPPSQPTAKTRPIITPLNLTGKMRKIKYQKPIPINLKPKKFDKLNRNQSVSQSLKL